MTTLKLKENGDFVERSVCFGVDKTNGNYELKNDTIWFSNVSRGNEFYKFGVIVAMENEREEIILYHNKNDTIPLSLYVNKNELIKTTYNTVYSK